MFLFRGAAFSTTKWIWFGFTLSSGVFLCFRRREYLFSSLFYGGFVGSVEHWRWRYGGGLRASGRAGRRVFVLRAAGDDGDPRGFDLNIFERLFLFDAIFIIIIHKIFKNMQTTLNKKRCFII